MFNIKKRKRVLLGLAFLLTLLTISLVTSPAFASELEVSTGKITLIQGDTITLDGYKKLEPANEHAKVPKWAKEGKDVKVGYYTQNQIHYYLEIGKPGKLLNMEKELEGRSRADY